MDDGAGVAPAAFPGRWSVNWRTARNQRDHGPEIGLPAALVGSVHLASDAVDALVADADAWAAPHLIERGSGLPADEHARRPRTDGGSHADGLARRRHSLYSTGPNLHAGRVRLIQSREIYPSFPACQSPRHDSGHEPPSGRSSSCGSPCGGDEGRVTSTRSPGPHHVIACASRRARPWPARPASRPRTPPGAP